MSFTPTRVMQARITAATPPVIVNSRGLASVSRTSTGIYVLTLAEECDPSASVVQCCRTSGAHGSCGVVHNTDGTLTVSLFDASAAAADVSFSVTMDRTNS